MSAQQRRTVSVCMHNAGINDHQMGELFCLFFALVDKCQLLGTLHALYGVLHGRIGSSYHRTLARADHFEACHDERLQPAADGAASVRCSNQRILLWHWAAAHREVCDREDFP